MARAPDARRGPLATGPVQSDPSPNRLEDEGTALLQLDSARTVIGAVLDGSWEATPPLMAALDQLVHVACGRLAAELKRAA